MINNTINLKKVLNNVFINVKINTGITMYHLIYMMLQIKQKRYVHHNKIVRMLLLMNNTMILLILYRNSVYY